MKKTKRKNDEPPMNFDMDFEPPPEDVEKWYTSLPPDPDEFPPCPADKLEQLREEAKNYLISESNGYSIKASKSSEHNWMRSVMAQGTGRDKMAALVIMVQEKPEYNINALQSLIGLVKLGKKECANCIGTLVELFVTDLLPPNKKLRKFSQRPLMLLDELSSGNPAGRRRRLVLWYFEDQLKDSFRAFIEAVKVISTDSVEANKEKAIKSLGTLLASHPEQEAFLLSILVNKMGDPTKKVAASGMLSLTDVLTKHPNMKSVIINEVEKLLFRSNVGRQARYYGICFLSQILFTKADAKTAANIINLYLSFFKACVKTGDVDSKMFGALLTGINRAYPYAREDMDSISEQLDTLYKIVHIAPFRVSLQSLSLLYQVSDYNNDVSDRFYSVLYLKLLNPALADSSHASMFLNLVFQALKRDQSVPRVKAFIKRLLQVCCYLPVPMCCATLFMISKLCEKDTLKASSFQPNIIKEECAVQPSEALSAALLEDDSEDEHYDDVPLDENEALKKAKVKKASKSDRTVSDDRPAVWIHKTNSSNKSKADMYNPMHRNPRYANAELSCYSELNFLSRHFHPTVALFASHLLNEEANSYNGDPLQDFTLVRFLERFSFKNPKKLPEKVSSLFAKRKKYASSGMKSLPVTSDSYLNQKEDKVPVDEKFLFTYLQKKRAAAPDHDDKDSDAESISDEEFDGILDNMMQKKGFKKDMDEDLKLDLSDIDEDLDFADEYTKNMTSQKTKKKSAEDDDDDDGDEISGSDGEDEDEEGDEDEVSDFGNEDDYEDFDDGGEDVDGSTKRRGKKRMGDGDDDDEELPSDFEDYDDYADDIDFGDDSEDEGPKTGKKKGKKMKFDDIFASAEEFSELIEAAGNARDGTSAALSNKDKASLKQLDWEAKRDQSIRGFGRKGSGKGSKKGGPAAVKRSAFKPKKNGRR